MAKVKTAGKINIITLTVGDWSRDGHNQFDVFTIKCNYTSSDLQKFHKKFKEKYNLSLENECSDYQDRNLSNEMMSKLEELEIIYRDEDDEYKNCTNSEEYADIYI